MRIMFRGRLNLNLTHRPIVHIVRPKGRSDDSDDVNDRTHRQGVASQTSIAFPKQSIAVCSCGSKAIVALAGFTRTYLCGKCWKQYRESQPQPMSARLTNG